ncbi:unnamed protein product [Parascedosporium putredinis]|uniref:Origin recognition complex subunit n=1 Tax=Parascedosporium putredinis TaxID=1442378 RepID=A0A9P1MCB6_9PEZI|nr:unnamed protein product [Parascedosporium putredinis]CAI7998086.1 unnamed protein product [Parascedosporium putredinis]
MSDNESTTGDQDHQAAYIFDPYGEDAGAVERPPKRRRTTKKSAASKSKAKGGAVRDPAVQRSYFKPLLNGCEKPEMVAVRERSFRESWTHVEGRIRQMLRDANRATLEDVGSFVARAKNDRISGDKIPCAFVVTGPNLTSQDLLFEQLEETLVASEGNNKFVRLRSADASNMKAVLRKIIQDITCKASDDDDGQLTVGKSSRKYLNYDLAAVHALVTAQGGCDHVFIAFQDSEGFDSSLLSDLILVFSNWTQIPFTLLFGIATSVELLQNRLRKSVCEYLHGTEFDVTQGTSVLEEIILNVSVTSPDVPLLIGGPLLESMIERQHDKVAGVQDFISALKRMTVERGDVDTHALMQYAYMTHFYANPLSVFLGFESFEEQPIQPEQLLALRSTLVPSAHHECYGSCSEPATVSRESNRVFSNDKLLIQELSKIKIEKMRYGASVLRAVKCLAAVGYRNGNRTSIALDILSRGGLRLTDDHEAIATLRKMEPERIVAVMRGMREALIEGGETPRPADERILDELADEMAVDQQIGESLSTWIKQAEKLVAEAKADGHTLRSKWSGQTKIVRTTVVAQKVQLSHDSAALTEVDEEFTKIVDELVTQVKLSGNTTPIATCLFNEIWYYDSRIPHKEVFIPRLREAGSLINVADLWTAFYGIVGADSGSDTDEKAALALFYQGLAELKSLGFVKPSKKKTDHIAKLKWL